MLNQTISSSIMATPIPASVTSSVFSDNNIDLMNIEPYISNTHITDIDGINNIIHKPDTDNSNLNNINSHFYDDINDNCNNIHPVIAESYLIIPSFCNCLNNNNKPIANSSPAPFTICCPQKQSIILFLIISLNVVSILHFVQVLCKNIYN